MVRYRSKPFSLLRPLVTKTDNYIAYLSSRQEFCCEGSGKSILKGVLSEECSPFLLAVFALFPLSPAVVIRCR